MRDAPPAEGRTIPYSASLPECDDAFVLAEIARAFSDRESGYWSSKLAIMGYDWVHESAYRRNGESYVPRRYCSALADFDDGRARRVDYNIGESLGFAGVGWGVEWCVLGLDRNHGFGAFCRSARP